MTLVAIQVSVPALYRPPVFPAGYPAHTIISVPVQTAVCPDRGMGALIMVVGLQPFVFGLYLPPVLNRSVKVPPPHAIISLPVQTNVECDRPEGALAVLVAAQPAAAQAGGGGVGDGVCGGSVGVGVGVGGGDNAQYLAPVLKGAFTSRPPQMIISAPVQTAL